MEKKRILFVVNPISGTGRKDGIGPTIGRLLDKEKYDYDICRSEYAGHAAEMAAGAAREGIDIVAAVGGDGTVNEVARAIVHTRTALAILPCGSGNGLARHLQIPLDTAGALRVLNEGTVRRLDYGTINGHPFFCTCGVGFDAFVSQKFSDSGRRGPLTYVENALTELIKYKPETYTVEDADGATSYKAFLIACANASQYGNNAYIAPDASMEDGLMDVTILEPFAPIEAPQLALQLFNKTVPKNSHVKTFRTKQLCIRREQPGVAHCDGDPFFTEADVSVALFRQSFRAVVNTHAASRRNSLLQFFSEFSNEWSQLPSEWLRRSNEDIRRMNRNLRDRLLKKGE